MFVLLLRRNCITYTRAFYIYNLQDTFYDDGILLWTRVCRFVARTDDVNYYMVVKLMYGRRTVGPRCDAGTKDIYIYMPCKFQNNCNCHGDKLFESFYFTPKPMCNIHCSIYMFCQFTKQQLSRHGFYSS